MSNSNFVSRLAEDFDVRKEAYVLSRCRLIEVMHANGVEFEPYWEKPDGYHVVRDEGDLRILVCGLPISLKFEPLELDKWRAHFEKMAVIADSPGAKATRKS